MESSRRVLVSAAVVALALGVVIGLRIHPGPLPGADTRSTAVLPSASTGEDVPSHDARPPARGSSGTTDEHAAPDAGADAARPGRDAAGTAPPTRSPSTGGRDDRDTRPTATATSDDASTLDTRAAYASSRTDSRYRTDTDDGDDRRWRWSDRDDHDRDGHRRSHDGRSSRHGGHR